MSNQDYQYHAMMRDVGEIMAQDAERREVRVKVELRFTKTGGGSGSAVFETTGFNPDEIKRRAIARYTDMGNTNVTVTKITPVGGTSFDEALKPKLVPTPKVGAGGDKAMDAMSKDDIKTRLKWLKSAIKYHNEQSNRLLQTHGRRSMIDLDKVQAYETEHAHLTQELKRAGGDKVMDANPLSMRTDDTLIHQINTSLRLMGKPEIKKGQLSRSELEALYRKLG